jgi:hypothetical protein
MITGRMRRVINFKWRSRDRERRAREREREEDTDGVMMVCSRRWRAVVW